MRRRARCCCLLLAANLAACALTPVADPPVTQSLIEQLPAEVPRRPASAWTLLVLRPQARPAIDTTQMAYALAAHQLAYYARNQWAETPPQMLQPLLVRTLAATGAFAAVVTPPHASAGTLGLRTEIEDLVQDYTQQPPVLRLALRVRLSDERTQKVLGTREIEVREPMSQRAPAAGVSAANAAMAKALQQVAQFVVERMP
jgi:cholesterol transport system auxiliary component